MHGRNLNATFSKKPEPVIFSDTKKKFLDQITVPSEDILKLKKFESSSGFDQSPYMLSPTYNVGAKRF